MDSYDTKYGRISGIKTFETYADGTLKDCTICNKIQLNTKYGLLTPQYEYASVRKKYTSSVAFYPDGNISRISLNEQTEINTPFGIIPAELITFYKNGNIKRLFPLNGKLSAYWDENEEYGLAKEYFFNMPFGEIKTKLMGISFYENGNVKDLTLWPKDKISLSTPLGIQTARIGFSLYANGNIKSFEPLFPIEIVTSIGPVKAFDVTALGLSGDKNSLNFKEKGELESLITSTTKIIVKDKSEKTHVYSPEYVEDTGESGIFIKPLLVEFNQNTVKFNGTDEYEINNNSFITETVKFSD